MCTQHHTILKILVRNKHKSKEAQTNLCQTLPIKVRLLTHGKKSSKCTFAITQVHYLQIKY